MTKYEIILYWSTEDDDFIAEAPELPGCAADGATRQEALANIEVTIAEWMETARDLGRSIPEPKGRLLVCVSGNGVARAATRPRPELDRTEP